MNSFLARISRLYFIGICSVFEASDNIFTYTCIYTVAINLNTKDDKFDKDTICCKMLFFVRFEFNAFALNSTDFTVAFCDQLLQVQSIKWRTFDKTRVMRTSFNVDIYILRFTHYASTLRIQQIQNRLFSIPKLLILNTGHASGHG